MTTRIARLFKAQGPFGPVLFVVALPVLILFIPPLLAGLLPDALYYTPLSVYVGSFEVTPLTMLVPLLAWPLMLRFDMVLGEVRSAFVRNLLAILLIAVIPVATCFYLLAPSSEKSAIMGGLTADNRLTLGHPLCFDPLLEVIDRCEGRDGGFMRANRYAVARYGTPVSDFDEALKTIPNFNLSEVPCTDLVGGAVGHCYAGHYGTDSGDSYFMNVYVNGGDNKALVIETANIAITRGDLARQQRQTGQPDATLSRFVDITRFGLAPE